MPTSHPPVLRTPVLRTTADDDLFIRMDQALGLPVVNQMVWRLTTPPTDAELDTLTHRLSVGRLSRLLRRTAIPLVRDHWVSAGARSGRRVNDAEVVADGELITWIDSAASTALDLVEGPVWELRSARLHSGGGVVSLVSAHAASDGAATIEAVRTALRGDDAAVFDARSPSRVEQVTDAASQAGAIARNLAGLARGAITDLVTSTPSDSTTTGAADPERAPLSARTSRVVPRDPSADPDDSAALAPVCIVSVPTADWNRAAADAGGSSNSLFIAFVLGMIVASGRAGFDDVVRISIPMSLRAVPGDPHHPDDRANATLGLSLDLPASVVRDRDLATVRALSKDVYSQRTARPGTFVRLQPVMQALGDRAVAMLSKGATTPLALASNLGSVDDHLAGLGDAARSAGMVTRSTTQAVSTARLRELRGGLAAWTNDAGRTTTISIIGLDPDGLGRASLSSIVHAELARWSLTAQEW